jgi:hypothetical protein
MGPREGPNPVENTRISCPCRVLGDRFSVVDLLVKVAVPAELFRLVICKHKILEKVVRNFDWALLIA